MTSARRKSEPEQPDWRQRLDDLVARGEARYRPAAPGPLPKIILRRSVHDLRRIARDAKTIE
jgi:hypothetical protein